MSQKKSRPFLREIGSHIRNCREERRIPRKSFAHSLQITPQQLSNIENGNISDIGIIRIVEIAHILRVDFLEIVSMFKK